MKIERIIFGVIIALSMGVYAYAESCSSAGSKQYKYTASGCSYSTSTRTCCSNGTWSDWDKECCTGAGCCTSGTCWNGSTCEAQISSKCGDQANMVYSNCVEGKGYLYYCVCKSDGTTKQVYKNDSFSCPDLSCYSGTNVYGVKTITISLNDRSLCNGGWSSTYNSICANEVASWFNSATKCYSGYKKSKASDYCVTSYSAGVVEPVDKSDFNYKFDQFCTYGRSGFSVDIACKAYGATSTCW